MNPTGYSGQGGLKKAALMATLLVCAFPRAGSAAVPPPPEAVKSGNAQPDAPVVLAALPPRMATDPWATQSDTSFMLAALPPAERTEAEIKAPKPTLSPSAAADAAWRRQMETAWVAPQIRFGGKLHYLNRRDTSDSGSSDAQSLMATLLASVNAPIWQPWFGSLTGEVGYGVTSAHSQGYESQTSVGGAGSASSRNTYVDGKARLSLLPSSRFPFEAHTERSEAQSLMSLSSMDSYTSRLAGFSQNYRSVTGATSLMFSWDNATQSSDTRLNSLTGIPGVKYRQRRQSVSLSQNLGPSQDFRLGGTSSRNTEEGSEQLSVQRNWVASHSFRSDTGFNVATTADTSRIMSHQQQASQTPGLFDFTDYDTRLRQLNSMATWRPGNDPLTMNGAVRVMALESRYDSTAVGAMTSSMQMRTVNLNVGAAYELTKNINLSGSANANLANTESGQTTSRQNSYSESAGINYHHDPVELGEYKYMLNGGGSLSNRNGENNTGRQLIAQLNHGLNRGIAMSQGWMLNSQVSQGVSANWDTVYDQTRQLTHSGLLALNRAQDGTSTLLQVSASDARTWGVTENVFQMLNFQATGSWVTGESSSWNASLTTQKTRANQSVVLDPSQPDSVRVDTGYTVTTTSSGGVGYRNENVLGVPRLQFSSDLRLNSMALLPVLGGPEDQETSSWENRLEYAIGRTHLRLNTRAAKSNGSINRSYLFMLTRDFGDI